MSARKIVDVLVTTDALRAAGTGVDSNASSATSTTINAASSFTVSLDKYTDYSYVTIHITNSGALTSLTGTMNVSCGTNDATVTIPASSIVSGILNDLSAASAYDNFVVIKSGLFTKLKLIYTYTSGSGLLKVRITASNM